MEAELHDGTVLEFPDGTDPNVIQRVVKQRLGVNKNAGPDGGYQEPQWLADMRKDGTLNPTSGMTGLEQFSANAGSIVPDLAMGAGQRLGLVDQETIDARKRMQAPLDATPAGKAGKIAGSLLVAAPAALIPGVNTVTGAALTGAVLGAAQPTATGESALLNTALGAAGSVAGQKGAQAIGGYLTRKAGEKAAKGAQNAVRDATMRAGQQAGYVVAPANANPTAWNRLMQGLAGKTATGQRAAMMNQETTNKLAREALGLAEDAPLTTETLNAVRKQAGEAYNVLRKFDDIALDDQYLDDILKTTESYMDTAKEFPELASKEIQDTVQMALRDRVSGNGLIAATRTMRDKADAAFRAGDKQLGRVMRGISDAMENAAERYLAQSGDEAAAGAFKEARQLIAKTYSVEEALNPGAGNVVASKLGQQVAAGKPLSGGLKTAGLFAKAFPRETQEVTNSSWLQMPGPSPLDYAMGLMTSVGTGNPLGMAAVAARPAANALITSKPYQAAMTGPSYAPGMMAKALKAGADSSVGQALARQIPPALMIEALRRPTDRE